MAHRSLLLMDADPQSSRVLEVTLRKAGYKVTTAADAARAQAQLASELPDLVLLDPALDSGGGIAWLAALRADPEAHNVPVMLICSEGSAELRARAVAIGIDDYVQKPLYVREVLARVELVLSRRERESLAAEQRSQMSGSLASLGFVDLLQTIDVSRKSGVLTLRSRGREGSVVFREGRVLDAECGAYHGEHALYRFLRWSEGDFELVFRAVRSDDQLGVSTQGLLMECMRRLDAWGALSEALPPFSNVLDVDGQALSQRWSDVHDEHNAILGLFDGIRSIEDVLESAPGDDLAALTAAAQLYQDGFLVERATRDSGASSPGSAPDAGARTSTTTLRPEGMLAAPTSPGRTAPGVRIGGVQLRRVLASALGERPSSTDVANAQGGPLRPTANERAAEARTRDDEGLKKEGGSRDVRDVRREGGAQEEAESAMSKRAKRRTSRAPGAATLIEAPAAEPAKVVPLSVVRSEARHEVRAMEPAADSPDAGASRARRRTDEPADEPEVHARATQPAFVDDEDHPDINQFFSSTAQARDTWAESTRFPESDDVDHDEPQHHGSSKRMAIGISLLGAALIGGFLLYAKVLMPTPAELAPTPVVLPTPDMMRNLPEVPAAAAVDEPVDVAPASAVATRDEQAPAAQLEPSAPVVAPSAPAQAAAVDVPVADQAASAAYLAALTKAQKLGFKKGAEAAFMEALALEPNGAAALSGLAILYLNQGKNADARARAEEALRADANDGTAWIVLGATHSARGESGKAREAYAKCAALPGKYAGECKRMLR